MASEIGLNQPPPYADVDLYGADLPLQEAVAANGAADEALMLAHGLEKPHSLTHRHPHGPTRR
jgi:hypothetical protein